MADGERSVGQEMVVELRTIRGLLVEIRDSLAARAGAPTIADVDLDGPHGDPVIKAKDPRDYTGPTMVGKRFSQTSPTYLDLLADRYDYFNTQPDIDDRKRKFNALDAARCRGWAKRLRAGWTPPAAPPAPAPWGAPQQAPAAPRDATPGTWGAPSAGWRTERTEGDAF